MPVFDTSALLPLLDREHPHHKEAKEAFELSEFVLLHPCAITEFTTSVRRQANRLGQDGNAVARQALGALLDQPRVRVSAEIDHDAACDLYLKETSISYTDAAHAVAARHLDKQPAITFDKSLKRVRDRMK